MSDTRSQAITATGLRKSYGDQVVLGGIDLSIPEGTIFSLLGPNGAGKTTTVEILSTLLTPDAGEIRVGGHDPVGDPDAVRDMIGVTGQFAAVDDLLTGEENLILMADLHHLGRKEGRRRSAELLERFDLTDAAKKLPSDYSGGMRRRLDIAMGLVGDPPIIFLDEPTTGLDPRSRRTMWEIIRELVAEGVTVFLTTQYLEEADQLADRIAVLDAGRIVAEGTPEELKRLVPGGHVRLRFADEDRLAEAERALAADPNGGTVGGVTVLSAAMDSVLSPPRSSPGVRRSDELTLDVSSDGSVHALKDLIGRLDRESIEVDELSVHTPDLDDVFMALTGASGKQKETAR